MFSPTQITLRKLLLSVLIAGSTLLAACGEKADPTQSDEYKATAKKEADAKATGGACRHAGRGIEDCYTLNPSADRASVFAGWKDMNDYMRENKMESVKSEVEAPAAPEPEAKDTKDTTTKSKSGKKEK
jgi:hypothetical protein